MNLNLNLNLNDTKPLFPQTDVNIHFCLAHKKYYQNKDDCVDFGILKNLFLFEPKQLLSSISQIYWNNNFRRKLLRLHDP